MEALDSIDDCGKLYLCQLATLEKAKLNGEEQQLIEALQPKKLKVESASSPFQMAVQLGLQFKSRAKCQTRYARCVLFEIENWETFWRVVHHCAKVSRADVKNLHWSVLLHKGKLQFSHLCSTPSWLLSIWAPHSMQQGLVFAWWPKAAGSSSSTVSVALIDLVAMRTLPIMGLFSTRKGQQISCKKINNCKLKRLYHSVGKSLKKSHYLWNEKFEFSHLLLTRKFRLLMRHFCWDTLYFRPVIVFFLGISWVCVSWDILHLSSTFGFSVKMKLPDSCLCQFLSFLGEPLNGH